MILINPTEEGDTLLGTPYLCTGRYPAKEQPVFGSNAGNDACGYDIYPGKRLEQTETNSSSSCFPFEERPVILREALT